jgi:hypothetical protein
LARYRGESCDVLVSVTDKVFFRVVDRHAAFDAGIVVPGTVSDAGSNGLGETHPSYPSCALGYCGTRL